MEVKVFIKSTISQIADAIQELNDERKDQLKVKPINT